MTSSSQTGAHETESPNFDVRIVLVCVHFRTFFRGGKFSVQVLRFPRWCGFRWRPSGLLKHAVFGCIPTFRRNMLGRCSSRTIVIEKTTWFKNPESGHDSSVCIQRLRIWLSWTPLWIFRFCERRGFSWLSKRLSASEEWSVGNELLYGVSINTKTWSWEVEFSQLGLCRLSGLGDVPVGPFYSNDDLPFKGEGLGGYINSKRTPKMIISNMCLFKIVSLLFTILSKMFRYQILSKSVFPFEVFHARFQLVLCKLRTHLKESRLANSVLPNGPLCSWLEINKRAYKLYTKKCYIRRRCGMLDHLAST